MTSKEMCDEFVCSDSGVVSLCDDDRKLLASLGAKKQIRESQARSGGGEREAEVTDNNNVEGETNRNTNSQPDQPGIEGGTRHKDQDKL